MSYTYRTGLYSKIEKIRGNPLICYVTSIRPGAAGDIAPDAIPELIKQINLIPPKHKEVDLLIVSNGGDAIAAARIISILRERFEKVSLIIPYVAYSAATIMAMGADEILMHPFSNLGPVDPQLEVTRVNQNGVSERIVYGTEDLRNYFAFVKSVVGISDQEQMTRAFELLCQEAGAIPLGVANRSAELSLALGERLLNLHMKDSNKAKTITETLSRSYHHHGYPLARSDAEKVGLPVVKPKPEIEGLMWQVWESLEQEMQCNNAFDLLEIIFKSEIGPLLTAPIQQVQFPSNLPQEVMDQLVQQLLGQLEIKNILPIGYSVFLATIESVRGRSENKIHGQVTAVRLPNLQIVSSNLQISQGWTSYPPEAKEES